MATPLKRQQLREAEDIERIIAEMRRRSPQRMAALGEEVAKQRLSAAHATKARLASHRTLATPEQLASVARQLETIIAAETVNPDTGEVSTIEKQTRVASLVDLMSKDGQLAMELTRAADTFRELFLTALGPSKGISSYGEYSQAAEPSSRMPATQHQLDAHAKLKQATVAAFGVVRQDGRWAVDEQLMQLVIPAMLSDKKNVTQGNIGQQRTRYTGSAQVRSAGGAIVHEVLERLSLHFQFRER